MFCQYCGREISQNALCADCGEPFTGSRNSSVSPMWFNDPKYSPESLRHLLSQYVFYCVTVAVLAWLFGGIHHLFRLTQPHSPGLFIALCFWVVLLTLEIASLVYWAKLFYRCWMMIQNDRHAETTPGLAVGLCFVPFFNCYWIFVAQLGLAKGMNASCKKHKVSVPKISEFLAVLNCGFFVFEFIGCCLESHPIPCRFEKTKFLV
jgi:hypothetical protein